jgi:hypothetical protein
MPVKHFFLICTIMKIDRQPKVNFGMCDVALEPGAGRLERGPAEVMLLGDEHGA